MVVNQYHKKTKKNPRYLTWSGSLLMTSFPDISSAARDTMISSVR
jgi:hypothetical protein